MTNASVRGGSRGLGYAKFLSWLWGHLGVQGKKKSRFCECITRFLISRVGGGGSHSCYLKDVLSHPPIRVCKNSETLWQQMKNVHNNKEMFVKR
jgi:hypothetical protein